MPERLGPGQDEVNFISQQSDRASEQGEITVYSSEQTSEEPDSEEIQRMKETIIEKWRQLPIKHQKALLSELVVDQEGLTQSEGELLPLVEIAARVGISYNTLYVMAGRGRVRKVLKAEPRWYTTVEEVERYHASRLLRNEVVLKDGRKRR